MQRKYWAQVVTRNVKIGPFESREDAIEAGYRAFGDWQQRGPCRAFSTGYGENSASFDLRFHDRKRGGKVGQ